MISVALNFKNEDVLPMNVASICRAVGGLVDAKVSGDLIVAGFGGAKIAPSTIPLYKMMFNLLQSNDLFDLFEFICNQMDHHDNPFKVGVMTNAATTKSTPYALRGWLLEFASKIINNFVPPENDHPHFTTPEEMEQELLEGEGEQQESSTVEEAGGSTSAATSKKQKKKTFTHKELWASLAKWNKRSHLNTLSLRISRVYLDRLSVST